MFRPLRFEPNPETVADNSFQRSAAVQQTAERLAEAACREVSVAARTLELEGVRVHLFDDDGGNDTPDSVFQNNWFSTHPGGHVAIYPMYSPSRRHERFSTHFNFEPMLFDSVDQAGRPIYHTNVLMCAANKFAPIGLVTFAQAGRAIEVKAGLQESGREVIALSSQQVAEFAGNVIELCGSDGRILALSQRAFDSLSTEQKRQIERSARLLPLSVPTVELAGGSARCMIAGIHLSPRH